MSGKGTDTFLSTNLRLLNCVLRSAAGKSQFGLQLSLTVQLPPEEGGLSGSACYLTTSSKLPTNRLLELAQYHPRLSSSQCGLSGVQTLSIPNIPLLLHVLSIMVPNLILDQCNSTMPVKLLVIDALAELFHSSNKTTTQSLVERSRNINEISNLLHCLASQYNIAILVLNEVSDVFNRAYGVNSDAELVYGDQSRWFARANNIPGEDGKEASLGLVWANQVNVRIMVSRTGRRRYIDAVRSVGTKIRRTDVDTSSSTSTRPGEEASTLIRRLSVIFSSVAPTASLDYIVTTEGVSVLVDDPVPKEDRVGHHIQAIHASKHPATDLVPSQEISSQVSPLDVGCVEDDNKSAESEQPVDEWDAYWEQDEALDAPYNSSEVDEILSQLKP